MSAKYLYEGNRQFVLTRELYSADEVRSFIHLYFKSKSRQDLQAYAKNVLGFIWLCIAIVCLILGMMGMAWLTMTLQDGPPKDIFPLLCFYICPLVVILAGGIAFFRGMKILWQPFDNFAAAQQQSIYQDLIQKGQCQSGQVIEIEILSPTTRRIHYTSYVHTKYQRGMEDATFITSSPVPLELSDTVVVLTFRHFRVLI